MLKQILTVSMMVGFASSAVAEDTIKLRVTNKAGYTIAKTEMFGGYKKVGEHKADLDSGETGNIKYRASEPGGNEMYFSWRAVGSTEYFECGKEFYTSKGANNQFNWISLPDGRYKKLDSGKEETVTVKFKITGKFQILFTCFNWNIYEA